MSKDINKQIEEAREYARTHYSKYNETSFNMTTEQLRSEATIHYQNGIYSQASELAELKEQLRWRSVEEEFPEVGENVLTMDAIGRLQKGRTYMVRKDVFCWSTDNTTLYEITHWLPIPRKEEE